jgi:hypothetical protein
MKSPSLISLVVVLVMASVLSSAAAFSPVVATNVVASSSRTSSSCLHAGGFLDAIFGPKQAQALHILIKGNNANQQCETLKTEIYKTAMKRGAVEGGVEPEALMSAVRTVRRGKKGRRRRP